MQFKIVTFHLLSEFAFELSSCLHHFVPNALMAEHFIIKMMGETHHQQKLSGIQLNFYGCNLNSNMLVSKTRGLNHKT